MEGRLRLLCHQSVYNALTDPLLDFSAPNSPGKDRQREEVNKTEERIGECELRRECELRKECELRRECEFRSYRGLSSGKEANGLTEGQSLNEDVICEKLGSKDLSSGEMNELPLLRIISQSPNLQFDSPIPYEFPLSPSWLAINVEGLGINVGRDINVESPKITDLFLVIEKIQSLRPSTASILSTDDEQESMVIVPFKNLSQILLFETDEEDDHPEILDKSPDFGDDSSTLVTSTAPKGARKWNVNSNLTLSDLNSSKFVMPRLSFEPLAFKLTIVSSNSALVVQEANCLRQHIEVLKAEYRLHLQQVYLAKSPTESDTKKALDADLLLIVNDGSLTIPELLKMLQLQECTFRFVVINLINSNYFINLLDIINVSTPYKIFKTSSLNSGKVVAKIHDLISQEMTVYNHRNDCGTTSCGDCSEKRKEKYKRLERLWKSEFGHENIDPLKLSSFLGRLGFLTEIFKISNDKTLILVSFSLGIGLGVALNAFKVLDHVKKALFVGQRKRVVAKVIPRRNISSLLAEHAKLLQKRVSETLQEFLRVDSSQVSSSFRARTEVVSNILESGFSGFERVVRVFLPS